jgi:hypothetical protein
MGRMCGRADRTFWDHDARSSVHNAAGRMAMRVIDSDRLLSAEERGYSVRPCIMNPPDASPKNHILVGKPSVSPTLF